MGLPATGRLSPRKQKFVEELVRRGNAHEAYLAAGYKESRLSRRKARALERELTREISEEVSRFAGSNEMAILGLSVLKKLAESADSEPVKLNAAKELLARTLPEAPKEVNYTHRVMHLSDDEIDARIRQIQGELVVSEQ
jgi:phage terminase small subunit